MIPVHRQSEPPNFDAAIRARGRNVNPPRPPVPGAFWKNKEFWRDSLDDLHHAYGRICAFTCFRIERVTGAHSVEHFRPKSLYPELAYEWDNFRLVCSLMNSRKKDGEDILDPFEIPHHTFNLNPESGELFGFFAVSCG